MTYLFLVSYVQRAVYKPAKKYKEKSIYFVRISYFDSIIIVDKNKNCNGFLLYRVSFLSENFIALPFHFIRSIIIKSKKESSDILFTVRLANLSDRDALAELWESRFHDSAALIQWFFSERFLPSYTVCLEEDGQLLSCVLSLPLHMKVRYATAPCVITCGVATKVGHEGRGFMRQTYQFFMNLMAARGYSIVFNHPAHRSLYQKLGHKPISDSFIYTVAGDSSPILMPSCIKSIDPLAYADVLFSCYRRVSNSFSGMISRSYLDFVNKCKNYIAGDEQCFLCVNSAGDALGYAFYYESSQKVTGGEMIASSSEIYQKLSDGLRTYAGKRELILKLPVGQTISLPGGVGVVSPYHVGAILNAFALLQILHIESNLSFTLTDAVIKNNNNTYLLSGSHVDKPPDFSITSGALLQWLIGYKSIEELTEEGDCSASISVRTKLDEIYPKMQCWNVDEY